MKARIESDLVPGTTVKYTFAADDAKTLASCYGQSSRTIVNAAGQPARAAWISAGGWPFKIAFGTDPVAGTMGHPVFPGDPIFLLTSPEEVALARICNQTAGQNADITITPEF